MITYTTIKAEFDFCSAEDGSKVTASTYGEGMNTSDKSTNKAMSAALKYAIIQVLAIPTEELIDSERDHNEPSAVYISNEQAKEINGWLAETNSDVKAFLSKIMKAESVEKILASDYNKAKTAIAEKKKKIDPARQPGDE